MNDDERMRQNVREMLRFIGDDPTREGLVDTPARVVRAWLEMFSGYREDPRVHLERQFETTSSQMVHVNGIDFSSTCEHHVLPFVGTVDIAYLPRARVVGLSKFARLVDGYARRLQIQERLTNEIADAIASSVDVLGVAVRVRAKHSCMSLRGARNAGAAMVTTALRGSFLLADVRGEWLSSLPD
jgi:GTP cyclohydrolase I